MSDSSRSRRKIIVILALLLLALIALLFFRCSCRTPKEQPQPMSKPAVSDSTPQTPPPDAKIPDEVLTPATVQVPASVKAGAVFSVQWIGPNNPEDYVTIVAKDAADGAYASYEQTRVGSLLKLTAPMDAGECEVRYVAGRSKKILGRAPIAVEPIGATLAATDEAVLGTVVAVTWTGPNNAGDYVTVVPKGTPDGEYGNYTETSRGASLNLTMPPTAGDAELRYMSGQGRRVLGRRAIKVIAPDVSLTAAEDAVAGSLLTINWIGPKNSGDYITIVAKTKPDGQYGNYSDASKGSPLTVLVPIDPGETELRYMTGQGAKVLARRALRVVAAQITLDAPSESVVGAPVLVTWTGPNHGGDYITIVPKGTPDGQYAGYANTSAGSPAKISAPKNAGEAEIRYMSGQGAKVLARRTINVAAKTE